MPRYAKIGVGHYAGQSWYDKPETDSDADVSKTLLERDTGRHFILYEGDFWNFQKYEESIRNEPNFDHQHRPSQHRQLGDSLSRAVLRFCWRLDGVDTDIDDLNSLSLTTNPSWPRSELYPFRGEKSFAFNGTNHGEVSYPDFDATEGFLIGGWFKTISEAESTIFKYRDGAGAYVEVAMNTTAGKIEATVSGSGGRNADAPEVDITDDRWHYVGVMYDERTGDTYLIIATRYEIEYFAKFKAGGMWNFTPVNGKLVLGAGYDGSATEDNFIGQAKNFSVYKHPDIHVLKHILAGGSDGISENSTYTLVSDVNAPYASHFELERTASGIAGHWHDYVINLDGGEYDVIISEQRGPNQGSYDLFINGVKYTTASRHSQTRTTRSYDEYLILRHKAMPRGATRVRIVVHGDMCIFNEISFQKVSGPDTNSSDSFFLSPKNFNRSNRLFFSNPTRNAPYGLSTTFFAKNADSYLEADMYAAEGGYHCTLSIRNGSNRAKVAIMINGKTCAEHEPFGKTGWELVGFHTHLKKGHNVIRVSGIGTNAANSKSDIGVGHFAAHAKMYGGVSDRVVINPWDTDIEHVGASVVGRQVGNYRFGAQTHFDKGDVAAYYRYFSGGWYGVEGTVNKPVSGNSGGLDVLIDDTKVLSVANATTYDYKENAFAKVTAGYHKVSLRNNDAVNPIVIGEVVFEAIGVLKNETPPEFDKKYVPIGAVQTLLDGEDDMSLILGDTDYGEIIVKVSATGSASSIFGLLLRLNDKKTGYKYRIRMESPIYTSRATYSANGKETRLMNTQLSGTSAQKGCWGDVRLRVDDYAGTKIISGLHYFNASQAGYQEGAFRLAGAKVSKIAIYKIGSATINEGARIEVFGSDV